MEFKTISQADYGIAVKPIISRNPQANSILEMVHQTIGNIIRTFKVQDMVLYDENPCEGYPSCSHCMQRYESQRIISQHN